MNMKEKRLFECEERRNFWGVYEGLKEKVESGVRVWCVEEGVIWLYLGRGGEKGIWRRTFGDQYRAK